MADITPIPIAKLVIEHLEKDMLVTATGDDGTVLFKYFPPETPMELVLASLEEQNSSWDKREISGIELIARERQEHFDKHGFHDDVDDGHVLGELLQAAKFLSTGERKYAPAKEQNFWLAVFNKKNHKQRLIVAASLLAAEYDRLQRQEQNSKSKSNVETK